MCGDWDWQIADERQYGDLTSEWPKRIRCEVLDYTLAESLEQGRRDQRSRRENDHAPARVEKDVVHFLAWPIPAVHGFTYRPGQIPAKPKQNDQPEAASFHNRSRYHYQCASDKSVRQMGCTR